MANDGRDETAPTRRSYLTYAGAVVGGGLLAGCSLQSDAGQTPTADESTPTAVGSDDSHSTQSDRIPSPMTYAEGDLLHIEEWRGSGPSIGDRPTQYLGRSMVDLPELHGELTVYLGGGEGGLYENFMTWIQRTYRNFTVSIRKAPSSSLANTLVEETRAGNSPADIFWSIDAGSVGVVADNDATETLPDSLTTVIPDTFHPSKQWVGVMGRSRSVPYNTNEFDAADIPDTVMAIDGDDRFDNMGWAPTYSAFQSFITAMRFIEGESRTREWLNGMQELGIGTYDNELVVANRVASGELTAGFSNHYYSRLVRQDRPDAPLELAFTQNDPGALIDCSAAAVINGTAEKQLAVDFVHHLLSIEAQEFLGTRGYEYPLLPSVPPVGDLPVIDELNPPEFDLSRLSDVEPTLQLLRDTDVL